MSREQRGSDPVEQLAVIDGLWLGNGVIEAELASVPDMAVFERVRGSVGVAFRVQNDQRTHDASYLRPTNGGVDDHVRHNPNRLA